MRKDTPMGKSSDNIDNALVKTLWDLSHRLRSLGEGKGSQSRILIVLRERGPITQRDLTEHLGIQPGSTSEVISKLESAGLIFRTPSKTDGRTANVALTETGREKAEECARHRERRYREMFSCLTEPEKVQLLDLLGTVNEDWKERYQDLAERKKQRGNGQENPLRHCK